MKLGVALSSWNPNVIKLLNDLRPALVQIPLHLFQPPPEDLDDLLDQGIRLIGKYVPPRNFSSCTDSFFERLFTKYHNRIRQYDFGGEPETRPDQEGCRWQANAQDFARLYSSFVSAGRSVSLDNCIGAGGFISATYNGLFGNEDRSSFLRELLQIGILSYMDFCSIDLYGFGYGGRKNTIGGFGYVKKLLSEFGHAEMPISVAEFGVPCSGNPSFLHSIKTEEEQARYLIQDSLLQAQCGAWKSIWFSFFYEGWGLLDTNLKPRPSYYVFQFMSSILYDAFFCGQVKALPEPERVLSDDIEWYIFEREDEEIHIVFLEHGQIQKRMPAGARAFDMFGTEIISKDIFLSGRPVYFLAKRGVISQENFLRPTLK